MNTMNPRVSVIILNWNGWEDTIECLESFYQINYPNYHLILVDNDSMDDSIPKIRDYCEGNIEPESKFYSYQSGNKPVKIYEYTRELTELDSKPMPDDYHEHPSNERLILIKNDKNYGFAEGNNIGIRFALKNLNPDYVMLLNNDTVVEPEFLSELVKTGENNDKIAVIGPKTNYYDFNGSKDVVWSVGGTIDLSSYPGYHEIFLDDDDHPPIDKNQIMEVEWISGAAMLIKREMLPQNLLNADYFFGCEDVDLCIELKGKGFIMVTDLKSIVWHKASVSKNKVRFRGLSREIKTNLKFMANHTKNYRLHLPVYMVQIINRYSSMLLKKIARDIKNS
jgi:GT2 family glycosyltransferase